MLFRRSHLFRYLAPYTGKLAVNVLLRSLSAVFATILVFAIAPLMSLLFGTTGNGDAATGGSVANALLAVIENWVNYSIARNGKPITLALVVGALFLAYFLKDLCAYLGLYGFTPIRNRLVARMRNDIFHKYLILPLSYYAEAQKGDLLSRISYNTQDVDNQMLNQIQQALVDIITVIFLVVMLFLISVPLSLFVLVLIPIIGIITSFVSRSLKRKSKSLQACVGRLSAQTAQTLEGVKTIKSYNAEAAAFEKYRAESRRFYNLNRRVTQRVYLSSPLNEILGTGAVVACLIMGGFLILHEKSLRPEVFIVYLVTLIQILPASKNVITAWYTFRSGRGSWERIKEVLNADEVIVEKPDAIRITDFKRDIVFEDVCFSHGASERSRQTLSHINLSLKKGEFIALVGPSGGGKSTLLNMIPRFFDPDSGHILFDGTDFRDCRIADLREMSALVSQNTVLFNDTIYNNIRLGNPDATREEIEEAARTADAHTFIMETENGYDTLIGEDGAKLSGGQRQRISIARALIKKAPILLFDEATSALDTEAENRIMDALVKWGKERNQTVVSVAHRLSSIRTADEIIVIDKGEIVGRGNHRELFENHALYRKLCRMQDAQATGKPL